VAIKLGESVGYIDHNGRVVIPPRFTQVTAFSDGLATACSDDCFYIDRSGSEVLRKAVHSYPFPFSNGLAVVGLESPQMYIDKKGRVVATYALDPDGLEK